MKIDLIFVILRFFEKFKQLRAGTISEYYNFKKNIIIHLFECSNYDWIGFEQINHVTN